MSEPIELTAELETRITASIRAGGYAAVAAQAWGVPEAVLERWLKRGRKKNASEPYRSFARNVDQALGQARLRAEMAAYKDDPKNWLKHGPGKERPGKPGWSALAKSTAVPRTSQSLCSPIQNYFSSIAMLRQVLAKYPGALNIWIS